VPISCAAMLRATR